MDVHFNARKIKYLTMDNLLAPIIRSMPIKSVNVFINLDDIFHKLHRPLVDEEFMACGNDADKQLIANVINLCGHYRQNCVRHGWDTRVYAYYTNNVNGNFRNELYIKNYRRHFTDISNCRNTSYYNINRCIHDASSLMGIMSQYMKGVYIIDTQEVEPAVLPYYVTEKIHKADWNLIISKDPYDFQYVGLGKWSVLYPKGDKSLLINQESLWTSIGYLEKMDPLPPVHNFPADYFVTAQSVIGDKYRNIPKIKRVGWKTMYGLLQKLQEESYGLGTAQVQEMMVPLLGGSETAERYHQNLMVTSVYYQLKKLSEIDDTKLMSKFIDIDDQENLKYYSRLYFKDHPFNLGFLLDNPAEKANRNQFGF